MSNTITIDNENYHITNDKNLVDLDRNVNFNKKLLPSKRSNGDNPIRTLAIEIYDQLDIKSPNRLKSRKLDAVICVLSNVIEAHPLKCVVGISRDKNHFKKSTRGKIKYYTYSIMTNVMDELINSGYIEMALGYRDIESGVSKRSRIWATTKLLDQLEIAATPFSFTKVLEHGDQTNTSINNDSISYNYKESYDNQPVILKGKKKAVKSKKVKGKKSRERKVAKELFFIPTRAIANMQSKIDAYNNMMDSVQVTIPYTYYLEDCIDPRIDIIYHTIHDAIEYIDSVSGLMLEASEGGSKVMEEPIDYRNSSRIVDTDSVDLYRYNSTVTNSNQSMTYTSTVFNKDATNSTYPITYSRGVYTITQSFRYKSLYEKNLRPYLYRVFNNGTFNDGGRFYGAQYQQLNSEQRSHILIDSTPTVEIDYKALHPSMLYHSLGKEVTTDPYDLYDGNQLLRKATKLIFNMALNAPSEHKAHKAFYGTLYAEKNNYDAKDKQYIMKLKEKRAIINELKKHDLKSKDILARIKEEHPDFTEFLGTGYGVQLQNKDSMMAADILNHFTSKNIACLCIHDSFIVKSYYAEDLEAIMKSTYSKHNNGFNCIVETK